MNVCLVVNNLDVGGLENVVLDLLRELETDAYRMHLICIRGPGSRFETVALPAERCLVLEKGRDINLGFGRLDLGLIPPIRRFLVEREIDIVHAHNLAPLLLSGAAARTIFRRPRILYSEHNQIYRRAGFGLRTFKLYANLADQIITVSDDLRRTLEDKLGVRPPVVVLHNGIDGARFSVTDGAKVRRELGIDDGAFVVLTAVVLSEQKGVRYLLEAARRVIDVDSSVRFVVAGDGPLRDDLLRRAEELELGDAVMFPGYRSDVPDLISACNIYALSSLWEGLPLALLEALAIGRPIVATTVGGTPEIVRDGENGFLVPPREPARLAERILDLRRDRELEQRIGKANLQRFADHFSLSCMVDGHAALYDRITA